LPYPENKAFKELISKVRFQKDKSLPFVIYQNPNERKVKAIFSSNSDLIYTEDFLESGFIFAPYDLSKKAVLFSSKNMKEVIYEIKEGKNSKAPELIENEKESYLQLVNKAIDGIKQSELKKVVVSRKTKRETEQDEFELFELLLNNHPSAFKYLWYHPKVAMWLGATPETLLKVNKNSLTTTSLAGTLPIIDSQPPKWGTKEVEEQQMVTDYILNVLSDKLINLKITNVKSVKAGKVWHLKSVIEGSLKKGIFLNNILKALHPTPAVCGLPKDAAQEFIMNNENYDREFYTGFLGELNIGTNRNTHLCVNLRCLKLEDNIASVFIGGGITEESIAESEWNETQHKSKTMLSLL
jgi:isochorismate synthase